MKCFLCEGVWLLQLLYFSQPYGHFSLLSLVSEGNGVPCGSSVRNGDGDKSTSPSLLLTLLLPPWCGSGSLLAAGPLGFPSSWPSEASGTSTTVVMPGGSSSGGSESSTSTSGLLVGRSGCLGGGISI